MREARLILPTAKYKLVDEEKLIAKFGGVTNWSAQGFWTDDAGKVIMERVQTIEVAYSGSREDDLWLYDFADKWRDERQEKSVYLRYGNGHVQLVTADSCFDNGEFDWNALVSDLHTTDAPNDIIEHPEHVAVTL